MINYELSLARCHFIMVKNCDAEVCALRVLLVGMFPSCAPHLASNRPHVGPAHKFIHA